MPISRAGISKTGFANSTVLGNGFCLIFRLYGQIEPWFDNTWRRGEVEL
jgi:hypothetical protein